MARVYISSTRLDLGPECTAVKTWLEDSGHIPVESYFPDAQPLLKSCLADIESCEVFILILGYRYGHRPKDENPENLSITHLEFRHAGSRNIPRIVIQQSAIHDVERSDIFDPAEMVSIKAFHKEVASSVRPGRFSSIDTLIEQVRVGISNELQRLGRSPDPESMRAPLDRASRDLLCWPTTLAGGAWLERPELDLLRRRVTTDPTSLTLLLGEPGCGKSALLARLGQEMQRVGVPVLGIKADLLPEDTLSARALADYLSLPETVLSTVQTLAEQGPVLVLVDQLDALADLVVQHSSRLRLLLNLIRDLNHIPNVHVVASCRRFEQNHDPSLRNLAAESLTLELPPWEAVAAILVANGVQADFWNPDLKETLRSPHALDTFLSLLKGTDEPNLTDSFQGMLQVQWEQKVLGGPGSPGKASAMMALAQCMAEKEVLWLPLVLFEDRYAVIKQLEADGLLILEQGGGRVAFRHQTLYEFVRARGFIDAEGSLTANVVAKQASLRVRAQLWHALTYLRRVAPANYQDELRLLWLADIRPHLRMLLIEFLGNQSTPLNEERQLAFANFDNPWFLRRLLYVAVGSHGWFDALRPMHLPMLMTRPLSEAASVQPLLDRALSFAPQDVLGMVDQYWLPYPDKDELSWRTLAMGSIAPQDVTWVDRLERLASRMDLDSWAIGYGAGTVSATLPDEAPRLIAAWIAQKWHTVRTEMAGDSTVAGDASDHPLSKKAVSLLEGDDLHDLPAIAEAAPRRFIEVIWPLFIEMLETTIGGAHPFVVGYRECPGLNDRLDDDDTHLERPLLQAVAKALSVWAVAEPEAFLTFLAANTGRDLMLVQRLLAKGLVSLSTTHPIVVFEFLAADPRRLVLGPYGDTHRNSKELIQAVVPNLDNAHFEQLEQIILNWHRYFADPADDAETRLKRLRWDREDRLRLLRSLPTQRMSPAASRIVLEEERAFPYLRDEEIWFSGVHHIGSPVSAEQMQKAKDEDIIKLFADLTDEHQWDHPRERMKGGAIQAGRELARLAESDVEKAVRLVRALPVGRNEIPVGHVLEALVKAGYERNATYSLIQELAAKGHAGSNFHHACASAVGAAVDQDHPVVPEALLDLMESWLVSTDPLSEEIAGEKTARERKESLLWGRGGMFQLPSGNFPILAALSKACLVPQPPLMNRWLNLLEGHLLRTESPRVWASVAFRYLRWLNLVDNARAQVFLDHLFVAYPAILGTVQGVQLMAYLLHWIELENAQRWLAVMAHAGEDGAQGSGELLMLRHALTPNEAYWGTRVAAILASTDAEQSGQRIGVTHAIVHLWSEPDHRMLAHKYLLPLLGSYDEEVRRALGGIFLSNSFLPDDPTRALLDALCEHPELLQDRRAEYLAQHLETLVTSEPKRVARVANALLDQVGDAMANMATSWYLSSEPLLAIALALQDMGEPHRTEGVVLFERMLEFNLPQAREMTLDLDKRTPNSAAARPPRRRTRRNNRK